MLKETDDEKASNSPALNQDVFQLGLPTAYGK
jgi:hypothetical protein